jgi:Tol biopolymer transport system component
MKIICIMGICAISLVAVLVSSCMKKTQTMLLLPGTTLSQTQIADSELVFDYNGTGNYEIYVMTTSGANVRRLTNNSSYDNWWPRISPDRNKILFYSAPKGSKEDFTKAELCVIFADGSGYMVLRPVGKDGWTWQGHAEWSPKGDEMVMAAGISGVLQIVITNLWGNFKQQVTNTPAGTMNIDPSWSPDGNTVVFNHSDTLSYDGLEIYTIPASTSMGTTTDMNRLTTNAIPDYDPYYSPDGITIAWLQKVNAVDNFPLGRWEIMKMNANGSGQTAVTSDGGVNSKPAWSLDGTLIYFHKFVIVDSRWEIYKITPAGTGLSRVDSFTSGNCEFPMN